MLHYNPEHDQFDCTECKKTFESIGGGEALRYAGLIYNVAHLGYCPNCGAKEQRHKAHSEQFQVELEAERLVEQEVRDSLENWGAF